MWILGYIYPNESFLGFLRGGFTQLRIFVGFHATPGRQINKFSLRVDALNSVDGCCENTHANYITRTPKNDMLWKTKYEYIYIYIFFNFNNGLCSGFVRCDFSGVVFLVLILANYLGLLAKLTLGTARPGSWHCLHLFFFGTPKKLAWPILYRWSWRLGWFQKINNIQVLRNHKPGRKTETPLSFAF